MILEVTAQEFRGERVLVVGAGTSALQFIQQLAAHGADPVWTTRRTPQWTARTFDAQWGLDVERSVSARTRQGLPPLSVSAATGIPLNDLYAPDIASGLLVSRGPLVHFTAHAEANAESPLESAVILSRDENGYKLYARDVAERPLSADLVTISACRSAGERTYAGEGLVGFAWAFLRAGARRVVAGLWDVDDRSTAALMGRSYANLAAGASPGEALRTAKLEMIRSGSATAKPYYWAPFQLFVGAQVVP